MPACPVVRYPDRRVQVRVQPGVPLRTVRAWLGHRSYGLTLRYAALAPNHLRAGVDVMDRLAVTPSELPVHSGGDR